MRSKLSLLFTLFLFALTFHSFGQNDKTIEIIATDTVYLNPIEFIYQIGTIAQSNFNVRFMDNSKTDTLPATSVADIKVLLSKNNFTFEETQQNGYTINANSNTDPVLLLKLYSEGEVKKLFNLIKTLNKITGTLIDVKYESIATYKPRMYTHLCSAATEEANLLASAAHRSVGQIISIEELKGVFDNSNFTDEIFNSFSRNPFDLYSSKKPDFKKRIIKRLIFKFQLL
jgi:hypothetical protein